MSGGGSQGSFETGVLRFLYDDLGAAARDPLRQLGRLDHRGEARRGRRPGDRPARDRRARGDLARPARRTTTCGCAEPWLEKLRSQANWASELRGRAAENGTAGSQARVVLRMLVRGRAPPARDRRHARRAPPGACGPGRCCSMEPVRPLVETRHRSRADRRVGDHAAHRRGGPRERRAALRHRARRAAATATATRSTARRCR